MKRKLVVAGKCICISHFQGCDSAEKVWNSNFGLLKATEEQCLEMFPIQLQPLWRPDSLDSMWDWWQSLQALIILKYMSSLSVKV